MASRRIARKKAGWRFRAGSNMGYYRDEVVEANLLTAVVNDRSATTNKTNSSTICGHGWDICPNFQLVLFDANHSFVSTR